MKTTFHIIQHKRLANAHLIFCFLKISFMLEMLYDIQNITIGNKDEELIWIKK